MANEKRLIDANAIKYREKIECCGHGDYRPMHFVTPEDIAKLPTVDAVEVVHGRWIEDVATDMIACTECGHAWNIIDNCTETFNYCPNCGACMMDGWNEDV